MYIPTHLSAPGRKGMERKQEFCSGCGGRAGGGGKKRRLIFLLFLCLLCLLLLLLLLLLVVVVVYRTVLQSIWNYTKCSSVSTYVCSSHIGCVLLLWTGMFNKYLQRDLKLIIIIIIIITLAAHGVRDRGVRCLCISPSPFASFPPCTVCSSQLKTCCSILILN